MGIFKIKVKNKITGNVGEAMSFKYLQDNGYEILETNYKNKIGEIDIIAKDEDERLIFVEVKTRATAKHGYPREAVNRQKQQKIKKVAEYYLLVNKIGIVPMRFDVIEILGGDINHIVNAF